MRPPNLRKWNSCIRQDHWRHPDSTLPPFPFISSQELSLATATASSVQQRPLLVILALFLSGSRSRLQLALLHHTCLIAFSVFSALQDQVHIPCHAGKEEPLPYSCLAAPFLHSEATSSSSEAMFSLLWAFTPTFLWIDSYVCFRSDLDFSHSFQEAFQDSQC